MTFVANTNLNTSALAGIYATDPGQFKLLFPQMADGRTGAGTWRTTFVFANRSTAAASATVFFYDDSGVPVNVAIGGQEHTQVQVNISALGIAQFQTVGEGTLKAGWAIAEADQSLSGIALFGFSDNSNNLVSEVGAPAIVPLRSMSVFVQAGASTSTAIALANPNSFTNAADVTLILRDSSSNELARKSLAIPSKGHLAK